MSETQQHRALLKTVALVTVVAALAIWTVVTKLGVGPAETNSKFNFGLLAISFLLAELLTFDIELRREAVTFTLIEVPITMALFFGGPRELIVGRVVIGMAVQVLRIRPPIRKIVLNLGCFLGEATAAVLVFQLLPFSHDVHRPSSWLAALAANGAANATSFIMVSLAMRWHGAPLDLGRMLEIGGVTWLTNTSLAVLAVIVIRTDRIAMIPLGIVAVLLMLAYRGFTSLSRRHASLSLLYEFTHVVSGSKQPDDLLHAMLSEARRLLRAREAVIVIGSVDGGLVRTIDMAGQIQPERVLPIAALRLEAGKGGAIIMRKSDQNPAHREILAALRANECIVAPLVEHNVVIGVLVVIDHESDVGRFDADDGRLFETLALHASVALENGRLIERLHEQAGEREHEALHDALTGLPNRPNFTAELTRAIAATNGRSGELCAALLDLDHFKEVNDTLGHHHGDLLLRAVAHRLSSDLPASMMIARFGGDEFALFAPIFKEGPAHLGRLVQQAFEQPFILDGLAIEMGASVGISLYPEHGQDPSTLLKRADVAMYDAKSSSSDRIKVYQPSSDVNTTRRLGLANDLRRAIGNGELSFHYQPKAHAFDGTVYATEALVRWNHPLYGMVPPDEFVPLAERTGLIQPFTHFVIEHGLRTAQRWHEDGLDLGIAMNLSTRNLLDVSLPDRVGKLLSETALVPERVTFEVTETSMMAEPTKALRTLQGLADLGVQLSIDDFGTGHSSLAYLQQLPVHEVKIDRTFISKLTSNQASRAIVGSVIHLAHSLGLTVVAEGVEDEATWNALQQLGCDAIQGYFLGRPVPENGLRLWLDARETARREASAVLVHAGISANR